MIPIADRIVRSGLLFLIVMAGHSIPAQAEYKAVAIDDVFYGPGDPGYAYATGNDKESARWNAIIRCQQVNHDPSGCYYKTISVPYSWSLAIVECRGEKSAGGSQYGVGPAIEIAADKLNYSISDSRYTPFEGNCRVLLARP